MINKKADIRSFLSDITEDAITATDVEATDVKLKSDMDPIDGTCPNCGADILAHPMWNEPCYRFHCDNCGQGGVYEY